jgi:hypothetical protein
VPSGDLHTPAEDVVLLRNLEGVGAGLGEVDGFPSRRAVPNPEALLTL